jgi:hypothetical protein
VAADVSRHFGPHRAAKNILETAAAGEAAAGRKNLVGARTIWDIVSPPMSGQVLCGVILQ